MFWSSHWEADHAQLPGCNRRSYDGFVKCSLQGEKKNFTLCVYTHEIPAIRVYPRS
jgi:hypothetical protein